MKLLYNFCPCSIKSLTSFLIFHYQLIDTSDPYYLVINLWIITTILPALESVDYINNYIIILPDNACFQKETLHKLYKYYTNVGIKYSSNSLKTFSGFFPSISITKTFITELTKPCGLHCYASFFTLFFYNFHFYLHCNKYFSLLQPSSLQYRKLIPLL